jgi:hypothetical protein
VSDVPLVTSVAGIQNQPLWAGVPHAAPAGTDEVLFLHIDPVEIQNGWGHNGPQTTGSEVENTFPLKVVSEAGAHNASE